MASSGEYPSTVLQRRAGGKEEKRGDAILISMEKYPGNRERRGAQFDRGRMETLFRTLYFDVTSWVDMKAEDLKGKLKGTFEGIKRSDCFDCFVCFVSAHGNTNEVGHYITDESGSKVYIINDILEPFMACDGLKGIPKVLFINSCRGVDPSKQDHSTGKMVEYLRRTGKDSLVVLSTEEGNESMRTTDNGTYFVQALYEVIILNHEKEDVGAMVTMATKMLRNESEARLRWEKKKHRSWCQVAPSHFNLTGKLYWRTGDLSESSTDRSDVIVGQDVHREKLKKCLMTRGTKAASVAGITGSATFGVTGMGGIGKTTLAKSLFEDEEIKHYYDHRVYWIAVKKNPNIMECQRRLIYEICKEMPSVNLDTEKLLLEELQRKLSKKKRVLLFLDDVWEKKHVDSLLGESFMKTLPPESKCIITSRKPAELAKLDTNAQIEKLDVLNDKDATTLFCYSAFMKETFPDNIVPGLRVVVEEVIAACGNMPILLTTLGADLWGVRSLQSWEVVRNRLRDIMAENKSNDESAKYQKLIKKLMISYDDLPEWYLESGAGINLKDYFSDFAAFPDREEIEIAVLMDMWTEPGLTEDGAYRILEELEQRCLVKIVGYWCYVHDIFRALAMKIVEEPTLEKRKRLFAWGIRDFISEKWSILEPAVFEAEKMVITRSELKAFHPRDTILFKSLTGLGMLSLTSNLNLVCLPPAIRCLTSLKKLDLSWCLGLKYLPQAIGRLESLQKLNLAGCCSLTAIPAEIGNLKKLLELNMQSCGVKKLPDEIGELTSLTFLCLNDCNQLEVIPGAIGNLSSLEKLECDMLQISEIPETIGDLSKLKYISFAACGRITKIPAEFVKLKYVTSMSFTSSHLLAVVPVELDRLVTEGSLTDFNVRSTSVMKLPAKLRALQDRFESNLRDAEVDMNSLHMSQMRGVLVDPTSVFDPGNKEARRVSFGLPRIMSMAKTEPFCSRRFDTAIRVMYTMANHDATRHAIVRFGGLLVLLRCIDKGDPERCGHYAAATLRNVCMTYSTHKAVVDAGGLRILTRVLHRKNYIRFYAYQALSSITNGDVVEDDYAFTSEINELCGHIFGSSMCTCIYCEVKQEFLNVEAKNLLS